LNDSKYIEISMISKNTLSILEFDKLLEIISVPANSDASRKVVMDICPLECREDIEKRLGQIQEIRKMSSEDSPLKLSRFTDISSFIQRVRVDGAVLESYELSAFIPVLHMASEISSQIFDRIDLTFLPELATQLAKFPLILQMLNRSIDLEGNILDSASSILSQLRKEIRRLEMSIQKKLEEMMRDNRISLFLQDDFITKRAGRYVIPIRMDSKGHVPGVVHDISKSGETAFIEPLSILNLSNELENLIAEEKAEELRVLRDLSLKVREKADEINMQYNILVYLDMLNCIAQFADLMKMQRPEISESGIFQLNEARHPLLFLTLIKTNREHLLVPLDFCLGKDNKVMVITGSNAGGKTIAIKTIGLLLIMALSGMPVPADSSSSFPLASGLLVDIGDEQSIENSLSTFSAHVSNISEILKKGDVKTVILIDELGTGTDPDEGTALSCAVLKGILQIGALAFTTTHLTGIKGFVHRTDSMVNASMEFDQKTLTPLYRLRIGEPGQSHALEVARKFGLPDSIVNSAKEMLGGMKVELDTLISDLNIKRTNYEKALDEISRQQIEIDKGKMHLEQEISEVESRRKEIMSDAHRAALDIVTGIKKQMYTALDEIKNQEKSEIRKKIRMAEQEQERFAEKIRQYNGDDQGAPKLDEISKGDILYIKSLGYDALVEEIIPRNNRVRVRAGNIEIEVPASEIGFKKGKSFPVKATGESRVNGSDEVVSSRINIVGLRVNEAVSRLEPFLNHASLAGFSQVTVVHGIGKGLLSKAVDEHLDGHPLVKKFRKGEQTEGGHGVTVVTLV
jgi:DNA mismatch repair protein MutS2